MHELTSISTSVRPNDEVQQRGRLERLHTSESRNAGPVCCNGWLAGHPRASAKKGRIKRPGAGSSKIEGEFRRYKRSHMATGQLSGIIQHLRRAMLLRDGAGLTDGQLLEDYLSRRDEAALAALVERHGPMVWGVCRRVLSNYHDAEDAFQATFLVLVRKAASIASRELLANWLYGVAHQTALKARATVAKRKVREKQVKEMPEPAVVEQALGNDLQPLLDRELSRLPDSYRVVIVLCDLEGMTRKEAAQHLDLPEGTVGSRLARARAMLAKRLTQRGVTLSGGALAVVVAQNLASAGMQTSVAFSTIKAASLVAVGQVAATGIISAKVAALTEGVLKAMLFNQLKTALAVLLMVTLVGIGATALIADDKSDRVGYRPPGIGPAVIFDGILTRPGEVALDANAGKNNPYFRESDPTNINHLWELRKTGDYFMLLPRVGEGELALKADVVKERPYFGKPDATADNCLWELRKTGGLYMIIPLVKARQGLDLQQEIEKIVKRAEEAGGDRKTTLDAMEKTVKDMKEKAKNK